MEEVISLLSNILNELKSINEGIEDACSLLNDIKGYGLDTSISDLAYKLDNIESSMDSIGSDVSSIEFNMPD